MAREARFELVLGALDRFSEPFDRFGRKLRESTEGIRAMRGRLAQLGEHAGLGKLSGAGSKLRESFQNARQEAGALFSRLGGMLTRVTAFFGLAGGGAFGFAKALATAGDEAVKSSQRAGVSARSWQQLKYAGEMSGVEAGMMESSLAKLGNTIGKAGMGSKDLAVWFQRAGVSVRDSHGKIKATDRVLLELADKFSRMPDGIQKTTLAVGLFGEEGKALLPFLNAGKKGIKELAQEAEKMGLVIGEDAAKQGEEFNDSCARLTSSLKGIGIQIGTNLLPLVNDVVKRTTAWIMANRDLLVTKVSGWLESVTRKLPEFIDQVFSAVGSLEDFFDGISSVVDSIGGWKVALGVVAAFMSAGFISAVASVVSAFTTLSVAMLTTPFGWVMAAIAGLVAAGIWLYRNWDSVKAYFLDFFSRVSTGWNGLKTLVSGVVSEILSRVSGWISGMVDAVGRGASLLSGLMAAAWEAVKAATLMKLGELVQAFLGWLANMSSGLTEWAGTATAKMSAAWEGIKAATIAKLQELVQMALGWLANMSSGLTEWAGTATSTMAAAWEGIKAATIAKLQELVKTVLDWFTNLGSGFTEWAGTATSTMTGAWEGIKGAFSTAARGILDAWNGVKGWFENFFGWFGNKFKAFEGMIPDKVKAFFGMGGDNVPADQPGPGGTTQLMQGAQAPEQLSTAAGQQMREGTTNREEHLSRVDLHVRSDGRVDTQASGDTRGLTYDGAPLGDMMEY